MKNLKLFFLILVFGIIQAVFLDWFKVFNVQPDLLLLSMVIVSLGNDRGHSPRWAIALSLFAGIFKDIFASSWGLNTFLFPLWSFFIVRLSHKISFDEDIVRVGLVFVATLVYSISCALILACSGKIIPFGIISRIIILGSFYNVIVFLLIIQIYTDRRTDRHG